MTPAPAITNDTQRPPTTARKVLTLQQETVAREFIEKYGLEPKQISFDGEREEPIFDFDALSILSLRLSDIPEIRVEPGDFNNAAGIATANCRILLADGRVREVYGSCLVGELMYDGSEVTDINQALKIAQARALRNGLRAVAFDPVRAHNLAKTEQQSSNEFKDVRSKELAEAHALGQELGYIVGDNKVAWSNLISVNFPGVRSSGDLNDLQRSQFLTMLRAWKTARNRANPSALVGNLLNND